MIYLLHFASPLKHAKHYIGFVEKAEGLDARMKKHKGGSGSKLMRGVSKAGIDFSIARIWPDGTRDQERRLKNRKEGPMLCPVCNPKALSMAKDLAAPKRSTVPKEMEPMNSIPCDGIAVAIDSNTAEAQESL